jgi:acyl-CoA synthetase (NDP forming)
MGRLHARLGGRISGVLVEPMITGGIETIVGVVQEPVFGPVVVFGLGGIATEVLADHAARLAPLTGADADDLIRAIGAARTLLEHEVDIPALRDVLLRVSRLADDLPQVAELDLNPLMARPDGAVAVDARIRVTSHRLTRPVPAPASPVTLVEDVSGRQLYPAMRLRVWSASTLAMASTRWAWTW